MAKGIKEALNRHNFLSMATYATYRYVKFGGHVEAAKVDDGIIIKFVLSDDEIQADVDDDFLKTVMASVLEAES